MAEHPAQVLQPSKVLHVSNLPPDTVNQDLMSFLASFGKVEFGTTTLLRCVFVVCRQIVFFFFFCDARARSP
jgi:hypothetical protein